MYVNLAWSPIGVSHGSSTAIEIEGEIIGVLGSDAVKYDLFFSPYDGLFLARVMKGQTQLQVARLHTLLRPLSAGRFSYVITVSDTGQTLCRSADQTSHDYDKLIA